MIRGGVEEVEANSNEQRRNWRDGGGEKGVVETGWHQCTYLNDEYNM